jgi:hypothetical protein
MRIILAACLIAASARALPSYRHRPVDYQPPSDPAAVEEPTTPHPSLPRFDCTGL